LKIDNIALHQFFIEKEITHLHHANTISSSITYINNGGLLSRGDVEKNGLFQTTQDSDEDDKLFDVWSDVFLDTLDLHKYFSRQNIYGPVLFKFNIDFLLNDDIDIWITKNNPIYWDKSLPLHDKYFQGIDELRSLWDDYEEQKKMITIRKPNKPVLFDSLVQIIVDDPEVIIYKETNLYTETKNALSIATEKQKSIREKFVPRKCGYCYCKENYLNEVPTDKLAKLFLPQEHPRFPK